ESFRDCTEIVEEAVRAPGPGEVLIRNHFAGVNGVYDQMMCLDRVEHSRVTPPADTGVEAVGRVEAVGPGVDHFAVGDPVATVRVGQGYRTWQRCPATEAIAVPETSAAMLAIVPSGVSAVVALEQVGRMGRDETVCITAAAGGLGNVMTQLAVAAGNHVVAVCGSDEKAQWLRDAGAARVIQYRREALAEVLAAEYADAIDLAMDSVGGGTFDALLEQLAPHGRLVVCGYTSDRLPTERVLQERVYTRLYWKAASVRGFMNYRFSEYAPDARQRLLNAWREGSFEPLVDRRAFRGLEQVADAVDWLLAGENLGKVVVDLR
ncbi:MAG: zinc-binding dehydrogenase, partial [Gammaproteobacteria bacterium]